VKGAADGRAKVQLLAKAGVNCIKLIDQDQMTQEEILAVVDEAHKNKFDPMYTIRAATYWPSVAMGADKDFGTITEGKYADIIAVKGDGLRYIDLFRMWIW
jgi:imidazolonepropionase-like amidohydrolase